MENRAHIRNNEELRTTMNEAKINRSDCVQIYQLYNDIDWDYERQDIIHQYTERIDRITDKTLETSAKLNEAIQNQAIAPLLEIKLVDATLLYLNEAFAMLELLHSHIFGRYEKESNRLERWLEEHGRQRVNVIEEFLDSKAIYINRYRIYLKILKQQYENLVTIARKALQLGGPLDSPDYTNDSHSITMPIFDVNYAQSILNEIQNMENWIHEEEQRIRTVEESMERILQEEERRRMEQELGPLLATIPTNIWKGFTKSDIQNLNSVFDTDEVPNANRRTHREMYACCPICLTYVNRDRGCIYIGGHNCKQLAERRGDQLYHRELYVKYKNDNGLISFCSVCSRICKVSPEAHFKLVEHSAPRPTLTGLESDPFAREEAGCIGAGGGGFNEKIIRFNAIRNKAYELREQIDTITKYEAFKQIVEAAWDSPLEPTVLRNRSFNVPNNAFPMQNTTEATEERTKKLIPRDGFRTPTIRMDGQNYTYIDDPPLIQFHHLDARGNMNNHEEQLIGPSGLLGWIESDFNHPHECFCGGYLYPQEIEAALLAKKNNGSSYFDLNASQINTIKKYTKKFYSDLQLSGKTVSPNNIPSLSNFFNTGDEDSMFHMAGDATCKVTGGAYRRTRRRRRGHRKSRCLLRRSSRSRRRKALKI